MNIDKWWLPIAVSLVITIGIILVIWKGRP